MVKKLKAMWYLFMYIANIIISSLVWKLYDNTSRFFFPVIFTITLMYVPILIINYFVKNNNIFYKNVFYTIVGLFCYTFFIYLVHGTIDKNVFFSIASIVTIYSFISFMLLHTLIFYFFKVKY